MNLNYRLAHETWGIEERSAILRVLDSGRVTYGPETKHYESALAKFFGVNYAVSFNSGSSANLAALSAFALDFGTNVLPFSKNVIVPMVSWSTTFFPVNQSGFKLRFVDVDPETYNIDIQKVESAIDGNTVGILAVNLLGNPAQLQELRSLATNHGLFLMEDNCESMGSRIGETYSGTFGDIGTHSTFFSHHFSTGEGGFCLTDDALLHQRMLSIRSHGWTRDLEEENLLEHKTGEDFRDSFRFVVPGFNLRPTEFASASGLEQLKKLPKFLQQRELNARVWQQEAESSDVITGQKVLPNAVSSWFGFGFKLKLRRVASNQLSKELLQRGVENRPIVAGNFTDNPAMKHLVFDIASSSKGAQDISERGMFIGNSHLDLTNDIPRFFRLLEQLASV